MSTKFAELDANNIILRVVTGCSDDVANNGGQASAAAAKHFEGTVPLSSDGVRWMEGSATGEFRQRRPGQGMIYDEPNDRFVAPRPAEYPSWTMDATGEWVAPVTEPTEKNDPNGHGLIISWDEAGQKWTGISYDLNTNAQLNWDWNPSTSIWDSV